MQRQLQNFLRTHKRKRKTRKAIGKLFPLQADENMLRNIIIFIRINNNNLRNIHKCSKRSPKPAN